MQFSKQLRPASLPLQQWFGNVPGDLIAGIVVALALIPEAIAFSIVAGVDPKVGLYASFTIGVITAFCGGRAGMISGATGAMALLVGHLVHSHGVAYLFAATILTGIIQMAFGGLRLSRYMSFVPRSVMLGFVNALAILIFLAQLPHFHGAGWQTYAMVALGLAVIYLLPRLTRAVPAPLVAIAVVTVLTLLFRWKLPTVGDMGQLPTTLPTFQVPGVPLNLQTLQIILPVALPLALVGILESLLTAQIVDQLTDTSSDKNREAVGQGIANVATGVLGGMAGCAMIGQSVINVKSGGRGRLSTFSAGVFLLLMVVFLGPWVSQIPMAALVAVMIMVSIGTFNWDSIRKLREHPPSSSIVMVTTVVVTVATHDLAQGVFVGVLLSGIFFAHKVGRVLRIDRSSSADGRVRTYTVVGQVFFASSETFTGAFDFKEVIDKVCIDVSRAHFWDITAVSALDKVVLKFKREGTEVEVRGLNEASATLVDRFAVHDKPGAVEQLMH